MQPNFPCGNYHVSIPSHCSGAFQIPALHRVDGSVCGFQGVLDSFLIEITSMILPTKDKMGDGFLVDKILDKTGMKGTGACLSRRLI